MAQGPWSRVTMATDIVTHTRRSSSQSQVKKVLRYEEKTGEIISYQLRSTQEERMRINGIKLLLCGQDIAH